MGLGGFEMDLFDYMDRTEQPRWTKFANALLETLLFMVLSYLLVCGERSFRLHFLEHLFEFVGSILYIKLVLKWLAAWHVIIKKRWIVLTLGLTIGFLASVAVHLFVLNVGYMDMSFIAA